MIRNAAKCANRLASEKSPYLLQHKYNPVDWYPWGTEAFERAKQTNRPIFLSVGYSTCHWCHVMEKESFENDEIAEYLNTNFISIKVDREERPDVDKLYMSFIMALTGRGGWPMSVFLTPDLAPITGGTYFPPSDHNGSFGFPTILKIIQDEWKNNSSKILRKGYTILKLIQPETAKGTVSESSVILNKVYENMNDTFDHEHGGFGSAPKFPKAAALDFLLSSGFYLFTDESRKELCQEMLRFTLKKIGNGGIHDHIGNGFHRYSVDGEWHVPHFEKMLYDQAQLMAIYADLYRADGRKYKYYCEVVNDIFDYMVNNLGHKNGGFYSAEDADSLPNDASEKKVEGAFYVWEKHEVENLLGSQKLGDHFIKDLICDYFDIQEGGNVPARSDPHGELLNKNVLRCQNEFDEFVEKYNLQRSEWSEVLNNSKITLKRFRDENRPRPHMDTKMIVGQQGLAITGLVKGYQATHDEKFLKKAEQCVDFIFDHFENGEALKRVVYLGTDGEIQQGEKVLNAFSDDYAFVIQALLDLYQVNGNQNLLENAIKLQDYMNSKFLGSGGYFISEDSGVNNGGVVVRMIEDQDGAEPCATSIAIQNLIRLEGLIGKRSYRDIVKELAEGLAEKMNKIPFSMPKLIESYLKSERSMTKIVLCGDPKSELIKVTKNLLDEYMIFNVCVLHCTSPDFKIDPNFLPWNPEPKVQICFENVCELPLKDVEDVKSRFKTLFGK